MTERYLRAARELSAKVGQNGRLRLELPGTGDKVSLEAYVSWALYEEGKGLGQVMAAVTGAIELAKKGNVARLPAARAEHGRLIATSAANMVHHLSYWDKLDEDQRGLALTAMESAIERWPEDFRRKVRVSILRVEREAAKDGALS